MIDISYFFLVHQTPAYCIVWTGLDWTGLEWTGLENRGLVKRGLVKRGLINRVLVKRRLVKRGLVKCNEIFLDGIALIATFRVLILPVFIRR